MALDEKQRERLAELRQKEAEAARLAQDEAEARELEALELKNTLESRGLKHEHEFRIVVNALGGVYAVRKPDAKAIRNWESASDKDKLNLEWMIGLLKHYIIDPDDQDPQKGKRGLAWAQTCAQRPGLCWQTSTAFIELMGVDLEASRKKG